MERIYKMLDGILAEVDALMVDVINESEGVRKGTKLEAWLDHEYQAIDSIQQAIRKLEETIEDGELHEDGADEFS